MNFDFGIHFYRFLVNFGTPSGDHFASIFRFFRVFFASWTLLGPSWALGGVLGAIFIDFSSILEAFWALQGYFLDLLGRSWGTFWAFLGSRHNWSVDLHWACFLPGGLALS